MARSENVYTIEYSRKHDKIGQGTYGSVFKCTGGGKDLALKCVKKTKHGIPNILEPSIMKTFDHPALASAEHIVASDTDLNIMSRRAVSDLCEHTRLIKGGKELPIGSIKSICYSLASAVYFLHKHLIIHGDIKASNVLVYADGSIRLSDFSLSVKLWSEGTSYDHSSCSPSHRPLECHLGSTWSYPLDIWSLGVTFWEVAYNDTLFPSQSAFESKSASEEERKARKRIMRDRYIHAHCDFAERNPMWKEEIVSIALPEESKSRSSGEAGKEASLGNRVSPAASSHPRHPSVMEITPPSEGKDGCEQPGKQSFHTAMSESKDEMKKLSLPPDGRDFKPFVLPERFTDPSMRLFNDLVMRMLRVGQDSRIKISEILSHPFFAGEKPIVGRIVSTPVLPISRYDLTKIEQYMVRYKRDFRLELNKQVEAHAMSLYGRCTLLRLNVKYKLNACIWIASKEINGTPILTDNTLTEAVIHRLEDEVCKHLDYRVHAAYVMSDERKR